MNIDNAKNIINNIPKNVLLVVVTKNQLQDDIGRLYQLGLNNFGENKSQAIIEKKDLYPNAKWHFIGRIQTNKIKDIVKNCTLIHSVSSFKVLDKINSEALKINKVQNCLIQFNVANEDTKDGFDIDQAELVFEYVKNLNNINVQGIMLMGPHTDDQDKINNVFQKGYQLQQKLHITNPDCLQISMGMSNDYQIAIDNHTTIIRIGSLLFR